MIGIITYHSAYNFGSMLQAYAMQEAVEKLAGEAIIINYRMAEQYWFYFPLYRTNYGVKTWGKDIMQLFIHRKRHLRRDRFEDFASSYFKLTHEVQEPEDVLKQWQSIRIMISGSDQTWNKHSCELEHNDWRYMDPYLLKCFGGRKVSYASSVGNMTDNELPYILPELRQFDYLSFRESVSAYKMSVLLNRQVETVLDPTFLLTKDEWIEHLYLKKQVSSHYILAYFLCGVNQFAKVLPVLLKLARKRNCKIRLVTPFAYLPCLDSCIEYHPEYGPVEFLEALYNADEVITDSYHGTILSVNFGKEFFSLCWHAGSDYRKTDILKRLGLLERVINDASKIPEHTLSPIDYVAVYNKLVQHCINFRVNSRLTSEYMV